MAKIGASGNTMELNSFLFAALFSDKRFFWPGGS
jgi:hypothetical protein